MPVVVEQPSLFPEGTPGHTPQNVLVIGTLVNRAYRLRLDDCITSLPPSSVICILGELDTDSKVEEVAQKYGYQTRRYPVQDKALAIKNANLVLAFPSKSKTGFVWEILSSVQKQGIPCRIIDA